MKASYISDLEKKIEALRINVAREWAIERGMRGIEDMTNEDWIAIYTLLVTKSKYRSEF